MNWVETLALPGGMVGAAAVVIVTLIKFRSTDRQELSASQQRHMDRLTTERNEENNRADRAVAALDKERIRALNAELRANRAEAQVETLTSRLADLTEQVAELKAQVEELSRRLAERGMTS